MTEHLGLNPGKYLGEFPVDVSQTDFCNQPTSWAMYFLGRYGQIDGDHHKAWVLDQVVRCLKGTPVIVVEARWDSGYSEYRCRTGKPSKAYLDWVNEMLGKEVDGEYEYDYYEGIPP